MTDELRRARHELRTPVNHILSYARLVAEEAEEQGLADVAAAMATIHDDGQRALELIDAVLAPEGDAAGTGSGAAAGELRALMQRVMERAGGLRADVVAGGKEEIAADLQRIEAAAVQLGGLVGGDPVGRSDQTYGASLALTPTLSQGERGHMPPLPLGEGWGEGFSADPDAAAPSSADPQARATPATLLVVDDNADNRDVLFRSLARLGYSVLTADDGRQALDTLSRNDVDLVLLDVMMPELDGYQVLERRRADPALRDIPFIMISAADDHASVIRCVEMGAEDYLPKPFDPILLRARIGACLEKKRLHDQEKRHLATIQAQATELAEWNRTLERRVDEQVAQLERVGRLKRFLPVQVAEMIVATGDESLLQSHRRQIAAVFCDLRGFTPFSEVAEPEEVMEVLGEYHAALGELIARYEGTVEHFAGDGLLVLFNDPVPCADPAARAVQMALAMRERMGELSAAWRRHGHTLGFGVGISLGYATLGQIGFEGRFHYAAIGSAVNLAARLCGEAKDGQILASQRVAVLVEEVAQVTPVGELALKGFRDPVAAFEVV